MEKISIMELTACICELIDLVGEDLKNHHNKVACCSYHLANAMGLSRDECRDIVLAAAIHDVGGLTVSDRRMAVSMDFEDGGDHAEKGYRLLFRFEPFKNAAKSIRFHHRPWNYGRPTADGKPVPIGGQIIMMADRIAVRLKSGPNALSDAKAITGEIIALEGRIYAPELVAAFKKISVRDSFWLDIANLGFLDYIYGFLKQDDKFLYGEDMLAGLSLICDIVDYRSSFTAYHSKGVAIVSEALAKLLSFTDEEADEIRIAGLLHDVGKLVVPAEILEKNGPLNETELSIVHSHPYYTHRVLSHISQRNILKWASFHHENKDGSGYPFCLNSDELELGSQLVKTADIFVALMEHRSYRASLGADKALRIMWDMTDHGLLSPEIVQLLDDNRYAVGALVDELSVRETRSYKKFMNGLGKSAI